MEVVGGSKAMRRGRRNPGDGWLSAGKAASSGNTSPGSSINKMTARWRVSGYWGRCEHHLGCRRERDHWIALVFSEEMSATPAGQRASETSWA